nr:uncharacterized protein LOC122272834 [Parasteatoda tepidariorum]
MKLDEKAIENIDCIDGKWTSFKEHMRLDTCDNVISKIKRAEKKDMLVTECRNATQRKNQGGWNEHFDNQLNVECVQTESCSPNVKQECIAPLSMIEIEEAVQKLKNNKAPGPDLISPEFIKNSGPDGLSRPYVENIIGEYQCSFRKGRSTTDQIFCIRQILEKTRELGIGTPHLFVDFKTAYDSVNRKRLIEAMQEFNIPDKLVRLTTLTLCKTMQKVKIQNDFSEPMEVKNGVRQGDALACLLFNLALEKIIRDSGINTRGHIFHKSVQIFAFVDDIDIIARTQSDLKQAFLSMEKKRQKKCISLLTRRKPSICNAPE